MKDPELQRSVPLLNHTAKISACFFLSWKTRSSSFLLLAGNMGYGKLWGQRSRRTFISQLCRVLFPMFLAPRVLSNLLAMMSNSSFLLSHPVSKSLCLRAVFLLCLLLCTGSPRPQKRRRSFLSSACSALSCPTQPALRSYSQMKDLTCTNHSTTPKGWEPVVLPMQWHSTSAFLKKKKK